MCPPPAARGPSAAAGRPRPAAWRPPRPRAPPRLSGWPRWRPGRPGWPPGRSSSRARCSRARRPRRSAGFRPVAAPSAVPTCCSAWANSGSVLPTVIRLSVSNARWVWSSVIRAGPRSAFSCTWPWRRPPASRSAPGRQLVVQPVAQLLVAGGELRGADPCLVRPRRERSGAVGGPPVAGGELVGAPARVRRAALEPPRPEDRREQAAPQLVDAVGSLRQLLRSVVELALALSEIAPGRLDRARRVPERLGLLGDRGGTEGRAHVGDPPQPPLEPLDLLEVLGIEHGAAGGADRHLHGGPEARRADGVVVLAAPRCPREAGADPAGSSPSRRPGRRSAGAGPPPSPRRAPASSPRGRRAR